MLIKAGYKTNWTWHTCPGTLSGPRFIECQLVCGNFIKHTWIEEYALWDHYINWDKGFKTFQFETGLLNNRPQDRVKMQVSP